MIPLSGVGVPTVRCGLSGAHAQGRAERPPPPPFNTQLRPGPAPAERSSCGASPAPSPTQPRPPPPPIVHSVPHAAVTPPRCRRRLSSVAGRAPLNGRHKSAPPLRTLGVAAAPPPLRYAGGGGPPLPPDSAHSAAAATAAAAAATAAAAAATAACASACVAAAAAAAAAPCPAHSATPRISAAVIPTSEFLDRCVTQSTPLPHLPEDSARSVQALGPRRRRRTVPASRRPRPAGAVPPNSIRLESPTLSRAAAGPSPARPRAWAGHTLQIQPGTYFLSAPQKTPAVLLACCGAVPSWRESKERTIPKYARLFDPAFRQPRVKNREKCARRQSLDYSLSPPVSFAHPERARGVSHRDTKARGTGMAPQKGGGVAQEIRNLRRRCPKACESGPNIREESLSPPTFVDLVLYSGFPCSAKRRKACRLGGKTSPDPQQFATWDTVSRHKRWSAARVKRVVVTRVPLRHAIDLSSNPHFLRPRIGSYLITVACTPCSVALHISPLFYGICVVFPSFSFTVTRWKSPSCGCIVPSSFEAKRRRRRISNVVVQSSAPGTGVRHF
eukprot:gene1230-biopygen13819